jgi:hypothetical protein
MTRYRLFEGLSLDEVIEMAGKLTALHQRQFRGSSGERETFQRHSNQFLAFQNGASIWDSTWASVSLNEKADE